MRMDMMISALFSIIVTPVVVLFVLRYFFGCEVVFDDEDNIKLRRKERKRRRFFWKVDDWYIPTPNFFIAVACTLWFLRVANDIAFTAIKIAAWAVSHTTLLVVIALIAAACIVAVKKRKKLWRLLRPSDAKPHVFGETLSGGTIEELTREHFSREYPDRSEGR